MNSKYRKTVIAGNWKMNKTPKEARIFIDELKPLISKTKSCEVVVCVPFVDLYPAIKATKGTKISVAAQNVHFEKSGAFTGEISADMLAELGVKYCIVGHSERREYFGETNKTVAKKLASLYEAKIRPILCVGETLEEREQGITEEVVATQIKIALNGVAPENIRRTVIAYEPIWAIGTGKTATSEQAESVCAFIRAILRGIYGARNARSVSILYGGSMNEANAKDLLSKLNIDGGLVGGASLKAASVKTIVDATK